MTWISGDEEEYYSISVICEDEYDRMLQCLPLDFDIGCSIDFYMGFVIDGSACGTTSVAEHVDPDHPTLLSTSTCSNRPYYEISCMFDKSNEHCRLFGHLTGNPRWTKNENIKEHLSTRLSSCPLTWQILRNVAYKLSFHAWTPPTTKANRQLLRRHIHERL